MKIRKICFIFFTLLQSSLCLSQKSLLDSLSRSLTNLPAGLSKKQKDSVRIELKIQIGLETPIFRKMYWDSLVTEAGSMSFWSSASVADGIFDLGFKAWERGMNEEALVYFFKSLKMWEEIKLPNGRKGQKGAQAHITNQIGLFYIYQKDYSAAEKYYKRSLELVDEFEKERPGNMKYEYMRSVVYNNLASLCSKKYNATTDKRKCAVCANNYYFMALKVEEKNYPSANDDKTKTKYMLYNNIGGTYMEVDSLVQAEKYLTMAIEGFRKSNDIKWISFTENKIARLYILKGDYAKAKTHAETAFKYAQETGSPENIARSAEYLFEIYKKSGDYGRALKMFELKTLMRDSVSNEQTKKAAVKTQLKYEYEKKSAADSVKNAEQQKVKDAQLAAQTATLKQEKFQRYSLVVGLSLVVCGLLFVINRFRITQKQKKIIEEQKIAVDEAFERLHEKNKEVMDSIHYAKRIQSALMTNEKYIIRSLDRLNSK